MAVSLDQESAAETSRTLKFLSGPLPTLQNPPRTCSARHLDLGLPNGNQPGTRRIDAGGLAERQRKREPDIQSGWVLFVTLAPAASCVPKYALLRYEPGNLGDEIQTIAARKFLPSIDAYLHRDHLHRTPPGPFRDVRLILNGWFTHHPENWPPHPWLRPLITSFHLSLSRPPRWRVRPPMPDTLLQGANGEYLRRHGPIGARDLWTLDLLQRHGIDSYHSGCLSLTLDRPDQAASGDYIVANDVDPAVVRAMRQRAKAPVVLTTHASRWLRGNHRRIRKAEDLLRLYAGAKGVVTSRLHCALPCLAYGTPVLLLTGHDDPHRFSGPRDMLRHCSPGEFLADQADFSLTAPSANPSGHLVYRDLLEARCRRFVAAPSVDG